jgi:bla regulator protein blaR1
MMPATISLPSFSSWWITTGPAIANHLWQSTLFAGVAALLALTLRHNHARVRFWLWFAASAKFLLPFSLLLGLGNHWAWKTVADSQSTLSFVVQEISEPFATPRQAVPAASAVITTAARLLPSILLVVWLCGFVTVVFFWLLRWRRTIATARGARSANSGPELEALRRVEQRRRCARPLELIVCESAPKRPVEPGISGVFHPVLLLPAGIADRLNDAQLEAIITHELCHVRRRDNLAAVVHMLVEAIFWFHPLVWWLGSRLVDERERACDEEVLEMGSDPQAYAEGILKVCEFYLESPLVCVAGVTGSNLKRRIEAIMMRQIAHKIGLGKKLLLAVTGATAIIGPVAVGLLNPAPIRAQTQSAHDPSLAFHDVSITPNKTGERLSTLPLSPVNGVFKATNVSLRSLIEYAYGIRHIQLSGTPDWLDSERYDLTANVLDSLSKPQIKAAMQELLADRFKLRIHREMKNLPTYELVVGTTGPKFSGVQASPGEVISSRIMVNSGHLAAKKCQVGALVDVLEQTTGRIVSDKTGLKGIYDFTLDWTAAPPDSATSIIRALPEQLGLELNAQTALVEMFIIDRVERIQAAP